MDEMYDLWGSNCRTAREEMGWTQAQAADSAKLSQATVSRIESGKGCPSDEAKYRLAYALRKRPRDLFPYLAISAEFAASVDAGVAA